MNVSEFHPQLSNVMITLQFVRESLQIYPQIESYNVQGHIRPGSVCINVMRPI